MPRRGGICRRVLWLTDGACVCASLWGASVNKRRSVERAVQARQARFRFWERFLSVLQGAVGQNAPCVL